MAMCVVVVISVCRVCSCLCVCLDVYGYLDLVLSRSRLGLCRDGAHQGNRVLAQVLRRALGRVSNVEPLLKKTQVKAPNADFFFPFPSDGRGVECGEISALAARLSLSFNCSPDLALSRRPVFLFFFHVDWGFCGVAKVALVDCSLVSWFLFPCAWLSTTGGGAG